MPAYVAAQTPHDRVRRNDGKYHRDDLKQYAAEESARKEIRSIRSARAGERQAVEAPPNSDKGKESPMGRRIWLLVQCCKEGLMTEHDVFEYLEQLVESPF